MIHFETVEERRLLATQVVADLSGDGVRPRNFLAYDGGVAFTGQSGYSRSELWVSDGTVNGTRRIVEQSNSEPLDHIEPVLAINGVILFTASSPDGDLSLYSTNGRGIPQALGGLGPRGTTASFRQVGKYVLFDTSFGFVGRTDGTPAGTSGLSKGFDGAGRIGVAGRYAFFPYESSLWGETMLARSDGLSRTVTVNGKFEVEAAGEAAGSTYVVASRADGPLGLYGVTGEDRPRLISRMASATVIANSSAGSFAYVIGQIREVDVPQLFRTDGKTLTQLTQFKSKVLGTATPIRMTADGVYFTDGGANLYVAGGRETSARLINTVPADAAGRAGVIDELAIARNGTVYVRRTNRRGSSLLRLERSGFRDLGPMTGDTASFAAVGNTAFFSRDDGTGYDELWAVSQSDRRASQKSAITGSPLDLGVQAFVPLKEGILAVTVAPANGQRLNYKVQDTKTAAYFLRDGRKPELLGLSDGSAYLSSKEAKYSAAYAAGSSAFFTVLQWNADAGVESANLYRTDGTSAGTRLMAVGLPRDLFYLGHAGSYAFFSIPKSNNVFVVPLRGRGKPTTITLPASPSGEVVVAGNNLYVQCGTTRVIELSGSTGQMRDLNIAARLPRGSVQQFIQVWNDQLVLLVQRRKITEAYGLVDGIPALLATYTATRDRTPAPPAMSRDGQTLWVITTDVDGSSFLIRMDLAAHAAEQSAVLAAKRPMAFLDSGKPISNSLWARGQFGSRLIYSRIRTPADAYTTDGTTPGIKPFAKIGNLDLMVSGADERVYSINLDSFSYRGLFQSNGTQSDLVSPGTTDPSDLAIIGGKTYFIASTAAAGREIMTYTYQPDRISGVVFKDLDKDGVRDGNELALAGVPVYIDANRDRYKDWDENTILTDASGRYSFANLDNGRHWIGVQPKDLMWSPIVYSVGLSDDSQVTRNFGLQI